MKGEIAWRQFALILLAAASIAVIIITVQTGIENAMTSALESAFANN